MLTRSTLLLTLLASTTTLAQHVTSPVASVVDVPARQIALKATTDPRLQAAIKKLPSCLKLSPVAAPQGRMVIPHHYFSGSHGPTNPAEHEATRVYEAFEARVTAGMNQYVATGSQPEAACALAQLDTWAQAKALLDYDPFANHNENAQSWYQSEWTLSSAGVTLCVLVNDTALDAVQMQRVKSWLNTAARKLVSFEKPDDSGKNNHYYWRGLAAASIGIATSDDKLYQYGVTAYKRAISEVDSRGALPREMERHERAIHYQTFALQPLVLIAELAQRQGTDLYGYKANGRSLRDAIVFFGNAAADPSLVKPYTPDTQLIDFGISDFAPYEYFIARFGPDGMPPAILGALKHPAGATRIGGSATVLAGK